MCCATVDRGIPLGVSSLSLYVKVNGSVCVYESWNFSSHPRKHRADLIQNAGF